MNKQVKLHIGTASDMGRRFVDAWKRAETGEIVDETHLTFYDLEALLNTLTTKRLELLRFVHQHGALSVRELSANLDRDYKNVHSDVAILEAAGLLMRDGRKILAPWEEVQASIALS